MNPKNIDGVAIRLADDEGIAAASLPRVASQIGVTANALYSYVGSKDELITLAGDRAWGEPPTLPRGDWREAAALWARGLFQRFASRPWLLDVPASVPLTPHNAAWLNALIMALEPTGMDRREVLYSAYLLDSHARYGAGLRRNAPTPASLRGATPDRRRLLEAVRAFLDVQLRARDLDAVADVLGDPQYLAEDASFDGFEFGLARILDGMQVHLEDRRDHSAPSDDGDPGVSGGASGTG